ncbi:Gypsy retrotransposon integrase-like protein 1-like 2 [Homarus americanus]|uniref:RNA-directed DNA polymerase n=1 Tax=Homarus americanus TaxID=6706 RepID=A0A8J5JF06_HOMAM|nr:Gypsy retrotransposon integrase-like protein 1-like 2 [Homarus americanus]
MVRKGKDTWLHLQQIVHYLKTGKYLDSVTQVEKNGIRKAAANFVTEGSSVYYMYTGTSKKADRADDDIKPLRKRLVITTKEERDIILRKIHDNSGHQGQCKTQDKIIQQYYWLSITDDVKEWIKSCSRCQFHCKFKTKAPEPHPIKPEGRWSVLCMGLIGPLHETQQDHKYIITMTDLFTKWVVAYPLTYKSGPCVAQAIVNMIHTHGPPHQIITNQGHEFVDEVNKSILSLFKVKQLMTSACHPQAIGQNEQTNQTVKAAIFKCCNKNQDDWDRHLNSVVYGINTSKQSTTKYSPFNLMYLREARGAHTINTIHDSHEGVDLDLNPRLMDEVITNSMEYCVWTSKQVKANIEKSQGKNKTFAEKKRKLAL